MNQDLTKKLQIGLTSEEVRSLTEQGLVNGDLNVKTKTYKQIIKDNLLSLFNLVNTILAVCIAVVGSWKNGLFFLVVIWNFLTGCVQEIRAKRTIDKLSLLSAPKAHVLRDGEIQDIQVKDILLGDITQLKQGNQICADAVILDGECQVNESLITGESTPIDKKTGDHLLSGSYVISGKVMAEVEHIGADNYVNQITLGAKYYKKSNSVIMKSVKTIVKTIAIAILPLAGLFVWNNFFRVEQSFTEAMVRTVAAISAMIPGGMVLLVSIALAVSVVRLSRHHTLVQDLYCVENLARVDVLCLDKTGTITEGNMTVESLIPVSEGSEQELRDSVRLFAQSMDDENTTVDSVREYFGLKKEELSPDPSMVTIPFSSDKKWSLLYVPNQGSYIMGAPEFVIPDTFEQYQDEINQYTGLAKRVVLFAKSSHMPCTKEGEESLEGKELPLEIQTLGFIVIGDKIRSDAKEILEYFRQQDVTIKVISGDDPVTVSSVAKEAGLEGAEKYIDATELTSAEEIEKAVEETTIFGRVTPYQKLEIVKALKAHGHTVAMTGDGANDVLALKEADCSIAMQSGSDAARNVSNMVLMDSNFASLPLVLAEGRKAINNLQRSSSLYLTKTVYAFIMAIVFVFLTTVKYPFENIQITLIGSTSIGLPSFFLALEPSKERIKGNFIRNVFQIALPSGILMFLAIITVTLYSGNVLMASAAQTSTLATYTALAVGLMVAFNISGKINRWKTCMIIGLILEGLALILLFPKLFSLVPLNTSLWILMAVVSVIFFLIHGLIFRIIAPRLAEKQKARSSI